MKKSKVLICVLVATFAVACGYVLWIRLVNDGCARVARMEKVRGEFAAKKVNGSNWIAPSAKRRNQGSGDPDRRREKGDEPKGNSDELTEAEEKLVDSIHDALNDEDQGLAVELAKQAVKSKSVEVRSEMVDTLRFFGDKVMPELLMFIDDPDDGVKVDAMAAYQQAIYDIEDDTAKAQVIEITMRNLDDADALEQIAAELVGMDDLLAVQTLVNVIDGESKTGSRIAKATYETVTGEEFTTFEAAESWIRDQQSSK